MRYLKLYTTMRINENALAKLKETVDILEGITVDLDALREQNGDYDQLHDDAWHAYACLDDFLDSYNRTISQG